MTRVGQAGTVDRVRGVTASAWRRMRGLPWHVQLALGVLLLAVIWYGVVGPLSAGIDPDVRRRPDAASLPPGGSVAVAMAAEAMRHEVEARGWRPGDGLLAPTRFLDRPAAYQEGIQAAVAPFVGALAQVTREAELTTAAAAFATAPDAGWLRAGWPPIGRPAARAYADGWASLDRYNEAVSAGRVRPPRGETTLVATLDQLALSLGAAGLEAERALKGEQPRGAAFARARGTAYAVALLVRGLREDHQLVIRQREQAAVWADAIDAVDAAVAIDPWHVSDSDIERQAFRLLQARAKLRAITAGLGA